MQECPLALDHPAFVEHQRRRFMRPDAERYARPDAERFYRPDVVRQLAHAEISIALVLQLDATRVERWTPAYRAAIGFPIIRFQAL
jgi:hypothetical protein